MKYLSIEAPKSEQDVLDTIKINLKDDVQYDIFESKKFTGDLAEVIVTVVIPVSIPFLAVFFQRFLEKKSPSNSSNKVIKISSGDKHLHFENTDIEEIKEIIGLINLNASDSAHE